MAVFSAGTSHLLGDTGRSLSEKLSCLPHCGKMVKRLHCSPLVNCVVKPLRGGGWEGRLSCGPPSAAHGLGPGASHSDSLCFWEVRLSILSGLPVLACCRYQIGGKV